MAHKRMLRSKLTQNLTLECPNELNINISYSQPHLKLLVLMTTEVLTPKNTSLWTSHIRNNSSLITQKVSTFQTNTFQNKQNVPKSYDRLPDEATFHLQSV